MIDHDRLFKELLTNFFPEFIELFFPHLSEDLGEALLDFTSVADLEAWFEGR